MHFIGIFTKSKNFEKLKEKILENIEIEEVKIININRSNIENLRNIAFETIIVCTEIRNINDHVESLKKIFANIKYLIINSEIKLQDELLKDIKANIITYGLNQKSTITVSSISEDSILISLQRNIENIKNKLIEVEEISIKKDSKNAFKIEDFMVMFAILLVYN